MKKSCVLFILVAFTGLALATVPYGALKEGSWSGTVSPPGSGALPVTYTVEYKDGELHITLESQMGEFSFRDINLGDDNLTFSWTAGSTNLNCDLKADGSGGYEGDCLDANGMSGQLTMTPPE